MILHFSKYFLPPLRSDKALTHLWMGVCADIFVPHGTARSNYLSINNLSVFFQDVQPPEEFVLVDENAETQEGASGTVDEEVPSDPLEVAIAKMRAMGFEDDSGWLRQLITTKGYDLNKVLDAMQFEGKN